MNPTDRLGRICLDYVKCEGAFAAGIAARASLAGGPPSTDLSYVMPEARSAVVFALALDQKTIPAYLGKIDRLAYEAEYNKVNSLSSGVAVKLAGFLTQRGLPSIPLAANDVYREESPLGRFEMFPPVSLRYLAVASGVGSFGLSGNVLDKTHGAGLILGAVLTSAELNPTAPLPPEENYCDDCRLCQAVCASSLMDPRDKTEVNLGGRTFSYSKRRSYLRCQYVCGGYAGLHASGKWSTWSPGRFPIPEDDEAFLPLLLAGVDKYAKRPEGRGGRYHSLMDEKLYTTCGNCQIVCHPDKQERQRRYKLLTEGGVVVQNPDGSLEALPPEEAGRRLAAMTDDRRSLYEGDGAPSPEIKALADQMRALAKAGR
ncbi:MAG: epoxyqueuosine reductase [Pseudomonadota bacterium]